MFVEEIICYKVGKYHNINLTSYYNKCLQLCQNEEFVVFTNDKEYAIKIFGSKFPIINESELDTLYLMSQCKGCICANFFLGGGLTKSETDLFICHQNGTITIGSGKLLF